MLFTSVVSFLTAANLLQENPLIPEFSAGGVVTEEVVRTRVYLILGYTGFAIVMFLLSSFNWFRNLWSTQMAEASLVLWGFCLPPAMALLTPWYLAPFLGVPSLQVKNALWTHSLDEALLALLLDVVVTITHFFAPIRFKLIWLIEVSAIASYILPAIWFDAPNRAQTVYNSLILAVLFFSSGVSHRTREGEERRAFHQLAVERELRYRMQFELEAVKDQAQKKKRRSPDELSVATTTETDVLWGKLGNQGLQELVEIGYKEHWLIPSKTVLVEENAQVLGAGSFGMVVAGTYFQAPVAVKMSNEPNGVDLERLLSIAQELRVLRQVRHPNIVTLHGACVEPKTSRMALVLERLEGMALSAYLVKSGTLVPHSVRVKLMRDVAGALSFLHSHWPRIVHGDLKGSNVLAEPGVHMPYAKLIDFGLARLIMRSSKPLGGTPRWAAPEVLSRLTGGTQGHQPKPSADTFSFGRLLYLAGTGQVPLPNFSMDDIVKYSTRGEVPELAWGGTGQPGGRHLPIQKHQLAEFKELSERCQAYHEHERPSMEQVLETMDSWGVRRTSPPDVVNSSATDDSTGTGSSPAPAVQPSEDTSGQTLDVGGRAPPTSNAGRLMDPAVVAAFQTTDSPPEGRSQQSSAPLFEAFPSTRSWEPQTDEDLVEINVLSQDGSSHVAPGLVGTSTNGGFVMAL